MPNVYDRIRARITDETKQKVKYTIMAIINISKGDLYKDAAGNIYAVTSIFGGSGTPIEDQHVCLELRTPVEWQLQSEQKFITIPAARLIALFQQIKPRA